MKGIIVIVSLLVVIIIGIAVVISIDSTNNHNSNVFSRDSRIHVSNPIDLVNEIELPPE